MTGDISFDFRRARGLVWVCDIASSSKYLNDNKTVDALETFLPRLHWLGIAVTEAAGGTFIKWTGDGFLAWFELDLNRQLGAKASTVLNALWQLTAIVNVTALGVSAADFRVRHGVTYEEDALISAIRYPSGHQNLDLIGRSVVLAFRLASTGTIFPSVVTQSEIVKAYRQDGEGMIAFKAWRPNDIERLMYFKNEKWGISHLYRSAERKNSSISKRSLIRKARLISDEMLGSQPVSAAYRHLSFSQAWAARMHDGPDWAQSVIGEYARYIQEDLAGALAKVVAFFETDNAEERVS